MTRKNILMSVYCMIPVICWKVESDDWGDAMSTTGLLATVQSVAGFLPALNKVQYWYLLASCCLPVMDCRFSSCFFSQSPVAVTRNFIHSHMQASSKWCLTFPINHTQRSFVLRATHTVISYRINTQVEDWEQMICIPVSIHTGTDRPVHTYSTSTERTVLHNIPVQYWYIPYRTYGTVP